MLKAILGGSFSVGLLLSGTGVANAADMQLPGSQILAENGLSGSIGVRYWYSESRSKKDLEAFDLHNAQDVKSHTAEIVATLEDPHTSGFFKAYAGFGRNVSGDVDYFSFASDDYEQTNIGYITVDGGWQFAESATNNIKLKGFVGYQYLRDEVVANLSPTTTFETKNDWHALRLGVSAEGEISSRVSWSTEFAAVPWAYNKVKDTGVSPEKMKSDWSYGLQAQAMLNVGLTENWDIGVGGRYWYLYSNFDRRWAYDLSQKAIIEQDYRRYGLLLESRYKF